MVIGVVRLFHADTQALSGVVQYGHTMAWNVHLNYPLIQFLMLRISTQREAKHSCAGLLETRCEAGSHFYIVGVDL